MLYPAIPCFDPQPFIGQIIQVAFNYAPKGWALCNGQLLLIADNQALFALLRTTYGGDGVTNFALPDLRGRFPLGMGSSDGVANVSLGQKGGSTTSNIAVTSKSAEAGGATFNAVSNPQVNIIPPYLGVNYLIATEGRFPN